MHKPIPMAVYAIWICPFLYFIFIVLYFMFIISKALSYLPLKYLKHAFGHVFVIIGFVVVAVYL